MERRTAHICEQGFNAHLLVCTTDHDGEATCGETGEAVAACLREELRERGLLWTRIHLAETSCLGCGGDGAAVAMHPQGEWYAEVTPDDVGELLDEI